MTSTPLLKKSALCCLLALLAGASAIQLGGTFDSRQLLQAGGTYGTPTPTPTGTPFPTTAAPSQCGVQNVAGGQSTVDQYYTYTVTGYTSLALDYTAFTIPDEFRIITASGQVLLDTGYVGDSSNECPGGPAAANNPVGPGTGVATVAVPAGTNSLAVVVTSPCSGTSWQFTLNCS